MNFAERNPTPRVEVNYEDDPLQAHPAYLQSLTPLYYARLNEVTGTTANDLGSGNNDGTYTGGVTLNAEGPYYEDWADLNTAASFDGTDDYVEHPLSATWQNLHAAWTLSAWIYPTVTRAADTFDMAGIVGAYDVTTDQANFTFAMGYGTWNSSANSVWVGFRSTAGGLNMLRDPNVVTLNEWAHYVGTWDGTTLVLYKNGSQVATSTPSGANAAAAGTRRLRIGKQDYDVAPIDTRPFFPGRLAEVAIFDYALDTLQVAQLDRYHTVRTIDEDNYVDVTALPDTDVYGREIPRLRTFSARRGRSDPTSRIEAGQASLLLSNLDATLFPAEPVNRLANPSAEAWDESFLPFVARNGTQAFVGTPVRTGVRSWSLTTSDSSPAYLSTERDGLVGMRPGEEVVFSAYVHVTTAGNVDLADVTPQIVYEVAGVETVVDGGNPGGFDAWQRVQVTTTIPADADVAYARIELDAGAGAETIYVDDVQLELGDTATTYCDGDQTDCDWLGEAHKSMSLRKRTGSPSVKVATPMRKIRMRGTWDGDDHGVFHGYLQRPEFSFPNSGKDSVATYSVVDGTAILAKISMRGFSRSAELVGPRVRAILQFAGIAESDVDVDDNFIEVSSLTAQTTVADDRSALSLIREIEETERGEFFVSRDGLFTYQGSLARSTEEREAIVFTDEDETGAVRYRDLAMTIDVATVANDVHIENVASGNDHHFVYPLSQQRFFQIAASEQSNWSQDIATDDPRPAPFPVAEAVQVQGFRDPDLWPTLLQLELGDLARIQRVHNGIDIWQGYVHFLEGISLNASPQTGWVYDYLTSPYPVSPFTASIWQTPISKPQVHVSQYDGNPVGASPIVLPSRTYTEDRLYVLLFAGQTISGSVPSVPTFTSAHTWTQIRTDSAGTFGRMGAWYTIPTATNTEALQLALTTMADFRYDVVILEIVEGFDTSTPIGDNTYGGAGSGGFTGNQTNGAGDVGTLTNAESVVLWHLNKDIAAGANWSGAVEVYDRVGPTSDAVAVAYNAAPGDDTVSFDWGGQANGWVGMGIEIEAE